MFPNRFAWPPDLPMTMFCEPAVPSVLVVWLTWVPGLAICSDSAFVRSTVSAGDGGWVKPPGSDDAEYGNGCVAPPTWLLSTDGTPVIALLAWMASIALFTFGFVLAMCAGAKPSGVPPG